MTVILSRNNYFLETQSGTKTISTHKKYGVKQWLKAMST